MRHRMKQFKKYDDEQLLKRFERIVTNGISHPDYERTVQIAKWCRQIVTGDDQDNILIKYKRRETETQQEQRIHITNSKTQLAAAKVTKLFNEVHRSDNVVDEIRYKDTDKNADLAILKETLDEFYQTKSLKNYLNKRYHHYNFHDPNAFLVIEFENENPVEQYPFVYPLEISSEEAFNFEYVNGVLQYLVIRQPIEYEQDNERGTKTGFRWTLYATGISYVLQHVPESVQYEIPNGYVERRIKVKNVTEPQLFLFAKFITKTARCPAMRFGYYEDPTTNNRTLVSGLYPAEKVFTDLIWSKSEYDLTKALHGFYQKFIYVQRCTTCAGVGTVWNTTAQETCSTCKGKGKLSHTTVQDVVEIVVPDDWKDIVPLSNLVHFAEIPSYLVERQKTDVDESVRDVFSAIFNENIFDRAQVAETATANKLNWRSVYNALIPYADHYSDMYIFATELVADILDKGKDLVVSHSISTDFKLESVDELIDQRLRAVSATVPNEIIRTIDLNILSKQHRDDPDFVSRHKARQLFEPLRGKSKEEKIMIITMLDDDDPMKVLYIKFDDIFDLIFDEFKEFADMPWQKQRQIVDEAVAAEIESLKQKKSDGETNETSNSDGTEQEAVQTGRSSNIGVVDEIGESGEDVD